MGVKSSVRKVDLEIKSGGMAQFSRAKVSIVHGFSTMRLGNMSRKYGDPNRAMRNQKRALSIFQFSTEMTVRMIPQHTSRIEVVGPVHRGRSMKCDALITSWHQVGLILFPADCFPVILIGSDHYSKSYVALVHSGREGTRRGIVAKTIQRMGALDVDTDSIRVAIGPGIGPCCYNGTDLVSEILEQTIEQRISRSSIIVANCCTYCSMDSRGEEHLFFSHARAQREQNQQNGRFMAFAVLG